MKITICEGLNGSCIKDQAITVGIESAGKVGLKAVAEQERRSLANMIEVMIRDYCGRNGVAIKSSGSAG